MPVWPRKKKHFNELKILPHKDIELMKLHHTVRQRRFSTMSGKDSIKLFFKNVCILSICVPFPSLFVVTADDKGKCSCTICDHMFNKLILTKKLKRKIVVLLHYLQVFTPTLHSQMGETGSSNLLKQKKT